MKPIVIEVRTASEMVPILTEYEQQMDSVQRRAYHLFEQRGSQHGNALDDWLAAQAQTLCVPQAQAVEDSNGYTVLTSLTGFAADRIRVIVSPQEMVLRAETGLPARGKKSLGVSLRAMTYYRFAGPVALEKATAEFDGGILRVAIPKQNGVV